MASDYVIIGLGGDSELGEDQKFLALANETSIGGRYGNSECDVNPC